MKPRHKELALAHAAGVLYAGAEDGTIRGWRVAGPGAGGCSEALDGHDSAVTALAAAPHDASSARLATDVALVSGCEGGALCGWRAGGDGAPAWRVDAAHAAGVTALAWSPSSGVIFSASWDGDVRATRAADGAPVAHWPRVLSRCDAANEGPDASAACVAVTALALGPRGALWAGGGDGSVARLCARTGAVVASMPAAHGRRGVTALAASPCGERLYSAGLDRVARAWTVAPPASWTRAVHVRYPEPFRAAMAMLRRGCADAGCVLGLTLGAMDGATRDGILELIAAALARVAYPEGDDADKQLALC
jgi:WD40 repeat protein